MERIDEEKMSQPRRRIGIKRFQIATPNTEDLYILDGNHLVSTDRIFDLSVIDYRVANKLEPVIRPPQPKQ